MTDVLDYLREQFARVHRRFDAIEQKQDETNKRLLAVERSIVSLHSDSNLTRESQVNDRERMDAFDVRLARIERRLELVD